MRRIIGNKRFLVIILVNIFLLSACKTSIIIPNYERKIIGTYESPNKNAKVSIIRINSSSTKLKPETQYIDLEINVNGRKKVIEKIYEEIDFYGEKNYSFEEFYPFIEWQDQNVFVLRLGGKREDVMRQVVIINQTSEAIDNIMIFADDNYLVTNILPKASLEIPIRWSSRSLIKCSLYATVNFADGKVIPRDYSFNKFSTNPKSETELLNGHSEKNEDCANGEIIVHDGKIDYQIRLNTPPR